MSHYTNDMRWITPTPAISRKMERGDMVKLNGTVTSIVDLTRSRDGLLYLALACGEEVPYDSVEVIAGHYAHASRSALARAG